MKNTLLIIILAVLVCVTFMLENRYKLIVDSPVVAKLDKITGEVWVANSGKWYKIENAGK